MKKLTLIKDQETHQEVYRILDKVIDEIKSDFFLSVRKVGKRNTFNFAFYKTDKNNIVYEKIKANNEDILIEVECFENL